MDRGTRKALDRMFHPRGIAVFGGVRETAKFGHMMLQSLLTYGYTGKIYPIAPGGGEVFGLEVFEHVSLVPGPVDLACVCVPAEHVPGVLEACLKRGVAGAEVLSSGFSETGKAEGALLEERLGEIARKGLRILGPNCFGAHCPKGGITLLPGFDFSKTPGPVSLISQSGGVASDFSHEARMAGLGLSKVLSFGNGCDLDALTLLDYLGEDEETQFVGAYLEGIKDGPRFVRRLADLTAVKPVVVWKGGLTPLGNRATRSHTGSLGGEAEIWKGALRQAGALPVQGLEELVDTLTVLRLLGRPGRRIALVGGGGAIGVYCSDLASTLALDFPLLSAPVQERLRRLLPGPGNSLANPVDTGTPVLPLDLLREILDVILGSETADVLVFPLLLHALGITLPTFLNMDGIPTPSLETYLGGLLSMASELREARSTAMVFVMENRANLPGDLGIEEAYRKARRAFQEEGFPVFPSVRRAFTAIGKACAGPYGLPGGKGQRSTL